MLILELHCTYRLLVALEPEQTVATVPMFRLSSHGDSALAIFRAECGNEASRDVDLISHRPYTACPQLTQPFVADVASPQTFPMAFTRRRLSVPGANGGR